MATGPCVVLTDTVCQPGPVFVRHGTVVVLDPDSDLGAAYGGPSNLAPLTAGQTGDEADHAEEGN